MIVACGFDHAGVPLRARLLALIEAQGHEVLDLGTDQPSRSTTPTRRSRSGGPSSRARPSAGSSSAAPGAGVSVAACKIRGIRAATDPRHLHRPSGASSTTT